MTKAALLLMIAGAAILAGCKPAPTPESAPKKSTLNTVIEGATGKTAIDAGKRAEAEIQRISAARNNDLNEALGE